MDLESFELVRVLVLSAIGAVAAFLWAPGFLRFLRIWKIGKLNRPAREAPVFCLLHEKKVGTPTMGGILIWATVLILAILLSQVARWFPESRLAAFSFLSRSETLLPLGAMVASALVGLVDDYLNVRGIGAHGGGLRKRERMLVYAGVAAAGAGGVGWEGQTPDPHSPPHPPSPFSS